MRSGEVVISGGKRNVIVTVAGQVAAGKTMVASLLAHALETLGVEGSRSTVI